MKVKVHHTEKAFKDKNGKQWYHVFFEVAEYEFAWVLSNTPFQPDAVIEVKLGKIMSYGSGKDFNEGRVTLVIA